MRVLFATDFYPPFIGGVELQVEALARGLAERGHVVTVATVWHAGLAEREHDGEITIRRVKGLATGVRRFYGGAVRRYHPPFPDPRVVLQLRRLLDEFEPDVVQAHGWIAYSVAVATSLSRTRPRMVTSVNDYGYACAVRNLLIGDRTCSGPSARKCLRHATSVYGWPKGLAAVVGVATGQRLLAKTTARVRGIGNFVTGTVLRDLVRGQAWAKTKVVTIPDMTLDRAADEVASAAIKTGMARLPSVPFVLFVGALQRHKGIETLLRAYTQLNDPPPLVLIGTQWPDSPRVYPAGATVLGDQPQSVVQAAWDRALFGVVPSLCPDGLPGVVREAMSHGKPVVGSRVGGIPEMVEHERTGLLVPPGDDAALARAMNRLIEDAGLRERLGGRARQAIGRFRPSEVIPQFEALYAELAPERN